MIRVLIVDDSPIICTSLSVSIEEISDTIVVSGTAGNGAKTLEWLEDHFADICITDIRMPVMNGLSLIKMINERYPWMESMAVSSYDEFEFAKQSIQLDAVDYIIKPIDKNLLWQALRRAETKLVSERNRLAAQILLKKVPHHRKLMDSWLQHIRGNILGNFPLLIVDTLELLEEWVEGNYYLLNALSNLWLQFVIEELDYSGKNSIQLDEGIDLGLGDKQLKSDQIRYYFRLCAVRRLEEGANKLKELMRKGKDFANVRLVESIKSYIREHCHEDISLQDLADYVELNKSYMGVLFKQETRMTIWNYIVMERMNKARNLLLNTNLKIYEIAGSVGYEDVNYFTQLFKKHYSMTPLDYKKRMER